MFSCGKLGFERARTSARTLPCSRLLEMMDDPETGIRQFHDLQRAAIAAAS
jgi:hypothetical protein